MENDFYTILGVSIRADIEDIKKRYRCRAKECHPDRGGSHEQMALVNEAWRILSDPVARNQYDKKMALRLAKTPLRRPLQGVRIWQWV